MFGTLIIVVIVSVIVAELIGYGIHRFAHWNGAGQIFRNHLRHHVESYPPRRYQSDRYEGDFSTSFTPVFSVIGAILGATSWVAAGWHVALTTIVVMLIFGAITSYLHDSFHIRDHFLGRFSWHRDLTRVHRAHHENMKKNFGIHSHIVDRIAGTFKDIKKS